MRTRAHGFTLIELMIVVAIIAIASALALTTFNSGLPASRTSETTRYVQTALLRARAAAVRTGRWQKVCIYRDPNVGDANSSGRIIRFECKSLANGPNDCPAATICNDVDATSLTPFNAALTDCVAGEWCLTSNAAAPSYSFFTSEDELNLNPTVNKYFKRYHTSIMGFAAFPDQKITTVTLTPPTTRNAVEITYGPTGTVNTGRSTTNFVQGTIFVANYDFCTPAIPPGGTCSGITRTSSVSYVLGGPVKARAQ